VARNWYKVPFALDVNGFMQVHGDGQPYFPAASYAPGPLADYAGAFVLVGIEAAHDDGSRPSDWTTVIEPDFVAEFTALFGRAPTAGEGP
jgi:hypothetical protein